MRILVVEDEPRISSLLERGLSEEGHLPEVAPTLADARRRMAATSFDLLLVDRMLPDGDGLDLVREVRERGAQTPILMLTARDQVGDRVEGLYGGADDYLSKPFSFAELLARITTVCRRVLPADNRIRVDDLILDLGALRVWRGETEIHLTAQEFKLLRYLAEHRGRICSKTRLLEGVWDTHHDPGTNVVEVYVSYLRTKIDKGHATKLIHTARGLGYVLEARPA